MEGNSLMSCGSVSCTRLLCVDVYVCTRCVCLCMLLQSIKKIDDSRQVVFT